MAASTLLKQMTQRHFLGFITRNLENGIVYLTCLKVTSLVVKWFRTFTDASGNRLLQPFGIEEATQHELGWKGSAFDGRGTASVAIFQIDYTDRAFQVLAPNPAGPGLMGMLPL